MLAVGYRLEILVNIPIGGSAMIAGRAGRGKSYCVGDGGVVVLQERRLVGSKLTGLGDDVGRTGNRSEALFSPQPPTRLPIFFTSRKPNSTVNNERIIRPFKITINSSISNKHSYGW
jgi:hypothetical protein